LNVVLPYLILFITSLLITASTVTPLKIFSYKNNFTDYPDKRKLHKKPIPRLGGISIFLGSFLSFLITFIFFNQYFFDKVNINQLLVILSGGFCFFLIGTIDDIKSLSPWKRLFFQVLFSIILWKNGFSIRFLDLSWLGFTSDYFQINEISSIIITIFWIAGLVNAINWLDGLDGLATGITIIAVIGFFIISFSNQQFIGCLLAINIVGSCLGFWFFNSYPATVFMGDGGSYYLGYNLAILGIISSVSSNFNDQLIVANPIYPIFILFLPILDMTFVIFRRLIDGFSPFYPDCRHIHHRLINLGFTKDEAIKVIFLISTTSSLLAILFRFIILNNP
tara:strand:+ start:3334 stop:4341 length:1008 start_codon:yes stop_codon:yes gene_type:complete